MDRATREKLEKYQQVRLRAADQILVRMENQRRLIESYLIDAQEEVRFREDQQGGAVAFQDGAPLSYWKGRESVMIEVLARCDKDQKITKALLAAITETTVV